MQPTNTVSDKEYIDALDYDARGERALTLGLIISGVRCILQYAILPFVLPVIGIAGNFAIHISLVINAVAAVSILYSVTRLWRINYKRKWAYTIVAVTALVILTAFTVLDLQALFA